MEEAVTVTRSSLEHALKIWDQESKSGKWSDRNDKNRFRDSANYLFEKLKPVRN